MNPSIFDNLFACFPHFLRIKATKKNRSDLEATEANMNTGKSNFATPAVIVTSLYGKGVKPNINTIQAFQLS
jgi:hypothetical protein